MMEWKQKPEPNTRMLRIDKVQQNSVTLESRMVYVLFWNGKKMTDFRKISCQCGVHSA